jgi:hypothetical protein
MKGGKVIGAGGFGCVFSPALKCKNKSRKVGQISKLMMSKDVDDEYDFIQKFTTILSTVPHYERYYLLNNITTCEPDKLTQEDLQDYQKCSTLIDENITSKNINNSLNKVEVLNMPYGGIEVANFIKESKLDEQILQKLNESLIDLLLNGIIPMNNKKVYHCDIKDSNVLADKLSTCRLIDWGLSNIYDHNLITTLSRRPFQFNMPYSIIMFNSDFQKNYYDFLSSNNDKSFLTVKMFVINYIKNYINHYGMGHISVINEINQILYREPNEENMFINLTLGNIATYITNILIEFTKNKVFDLQKYMDDVFLKNVDIWGFVMIYVSIIEEISKLKYINTDQKNIIEKIKIIIELLLKYSSKPIDIPILTKILKNIFIKQKQAQGKRKLKNLVKSNKIDIPSNNLHKSKISINHKKTVKLNIKQLLKKNSKSKKNKK